MAFPAKSDDKTTAVATAFITSTPRYRGLILPSERVAETPATRVLASRLHGVAPTDAVSFAGGTLYLLAAALAASAIPALRASRIDPMTAIREE
jgi:ABC-type antimicrobial peptide transport system permease subunit